MFIYLKRKKKISPQRQIDFLSLQRWEDEEERRKILLEKHSRGSLARSSRETRIQEKEGRKMLRVERYYDLLSCWNIVENERQASDQKLPVIW